MITISQLLAMPVGEKIGGGFVLTVKTTKKWIRLPDNNYVFTVVLIDETGEILADFKNATYDPIQKQDTIAIRNGQVQAAEADSGLRASQEGKKLWIEQYTIVTSNASRTADSIRSYENMGEDFPDWETIVRGKIRHGIVCSYIQSGRDVPQASYIESLVEYIFTGEQK